MGRVGLTNLVHLFPKASFNCSWRKLDHIPTEIWDNATTLDLSQNHLNLTNSQHLRQLQRLDQLVTLNLSGNYLPLLGKDNLCSLPSLHTLDLSGCQLTSIEAGALQGLPRLGKLFLGHNRLQVPLSVSTRDIVTISFLDLHGNQELDHGSDDSSTGIRRPFHRKLLTEVIELPSPTPANSMTTTNGMDLSYITYFCFIISINFYVLSINYLLSRLLI